MLSLRTAAGFSAALLLTSQLPARAATFNVADGDVVGFVAAVNASNNNIFGDTINLAPGGRYEFTVAATNVNGPSALPSITSLITINGNGATLTRAADSPAMRFIRVNLSGNLTINELTLANGQSDAHGGGALRVESGQLAMSRCTLVNNLAPNANGGAVFAPNGKLTFTNCTLSNNACDGSGGALYCDNTGGRITLEHVTMSGNSAGASGGGVYVSDGATLTLTHSLLANGGCAVESATVNDLGHNLTDDGSCISAASSFATDPMLEPLSDNGGNSFTHALPFNSPAVDAIPVDECDVAFDQRDVERPNGNGCDIGAYEAVIPPSLAISDTSDDEAAGTLSFFITLSFAHTADVTVDVSTSNGNAESGSDFVSTQVTAHIPAGDLSTSVNVQVVDDGVEEPDESLTVTLSNPTNAILNQDTATGTILNDDVAPTPSCASGLAFEADDSCHASIDSMALLTEAVTVDPRCAPLHVTASPAGPYPFGTNVVTVTAMDDCGQSNSCSVTFEVVGGPPATFDCPTNSLILGTNTGSCRASVQGNAADPTFTTGCANQLVLVTNDFNGASSLANAELPLGMSSILWTLTAEDGTVDSCTTTIEVIDDESPTMACPIGVTFDNAPDEFMASAFDNCDDAPTVTCAPATLDALIAEGGNVVTCTAIDVAGNTSTCTFTVSNGNDFDVSAAIDDLIGLVKQLRSNGALKRNQINSLTQQLKQARRKFNSGFTTPACSQISAFRAQVESLQFEGVLSEINAAPLLAGADDILNQACGDEEDDEESAGRDLLEPDGNNESSGSDGDDDEDSETTSPPSRRECADTSTLPLVMLPLMMVSMRSRRRKTKH